MGWLGKVGGFLMDPMDLFGGDEKKKAAEEQLAAQQAALEQQQANIDTARSNMQENVGKATGALDQAYQQGGQSLSRQYGAATGLLGKGYDQSRGDLATLQGLQRYGSGATQAVQSGQLDPYDVTGQRSALEGRMSQGDQLSQRIDQQTDIEADPGYQFRVQQGEQAINRSAAARGGRLGGSTLKALADYNQNMASQEYGAADQRNMQRTQQQMALLGQQYGAAGNVDQMRQQALLNQAGRTDAAGQQAIQNNLNAQLAAQQNQMRLAEMGYGAQGALSQLAMQQGMTGAGMATDLGQNQASLASAYGQNTANVYTSQSGNEAALMGAANQAQQNYAQYPGMVNQAVGNNKSGIVNTAASVFGGMLGGKSDRNAKKEVRDGSTAAREVLESMKPYTFEYKDQKDGIGRFLGVMAQDLETSESGKDMVVNTGDGKMIDLTRAVMALLGMVAHLSNEIESIKKERQRQ